MLTQKQVIDKSYSHRLSWRSYQRLSSAISKHQELADVLLSVRIKGCKSFVINIFLCNQHILDRIVKKAVNNISGQLTAQLLNYQTLTLSALYCIFLRLDRSGFENCREIRHLLRKQRNVYLLSQYMKDKLDLC